MESLKYGEAKIRQELGSVSPLYGDEGSAAAERATVFY